jgi:uncharacterized protein
MSASELINYFNLQPHQEGGYFRETYRSDELIPQEGLPMRFQGPRNYSTAIYFLLEDEQFSAFHRIKSDELWHFYLGGPLNIFVINEMGQFEIIKMGSNLANGEVFQAVVKAGCWFASQPIQSGHFSFVGCTVAPGFDFNDFELANADLLSAEFPQHDALIRRYCR